MAPPTVARQIGFLPFPQRYITQLPWVWTTGLSASASYVTGGVTYRLNSPYDPDTGVGGASARQFAALAALYGRRANQSARTAIADRDLMVLENSALRPLMNTGAQEVSYDLDVPINVPFGISPARLFDEIEYSSATTTNPVNEVYLDVLCYDTNAVASSSYVAIAITYYTTFFEQKQS